MKRQKVKIEKVTGPEHYYLVGSFGDVVDITIDEASGLFSASGSFGTFSHYWSAPGPRGLKAFLGGIQYDYAMGKFRANGGFVFDHEKSIRALRKLIFKDPYRVTDLTPDQKSHIREDLANLKCTDCTTEDDFFREVQDCEGIREALGDEWYLQVPNERKLHGECAAFWNDFFIPFVASYMPNHQCKRVPYR
jgi:hypothetical protein